MEKVDQNPITMAYGGKVLFVEKCLEITTVA
jgi:hypothetical protein